MIMFFGDTGEKIYGIDVVARLSDRDIEKLTWLFRGSPLLPELRVKGSFVGPRAEMVTPWSTNAVEITQNMTIDGIVRIEQFVAVVEEDPVYDHMVSQYYSQLHQDIFRLPRQPQEVLLIDDIAAYNDQEGLSLSPEEINYLIDLSQRLERPLTDSEVFGFSQVNSEHCRHKIFNGTFVIDGVAQEYSLFEWIKKTSQAHPNSIVSAYKDNVAFVKGPTVVQFAPSDPSRPSNYAKKRFESVLSLKAETHNFPTTVEPFNGAATGSGGEIRDRLAGGKGSLPLAGTAVYMTSYPRLGGDRPWVDALIPRPWLYQSPLDILIKASNGASDFGNKFGQPLISGSVLTFEHLEDGQWMAYDKVIMEAGGIGYGKADQALKGQPHRGDQIVLLGGDNYRIGMGGAAVSSADTGALGKGIELNAVQRSNPEMQKRVANTIRGMMEEDVNVIVSIHDHGAGGHLNCFSELVEDVGGNILLDRLPIGDPTLSAKEIIGNESQERMGLVIAKEDVARLKAVADRERAPMYIVGEVTGDFRFQMTSEKSDVIPIDLKLEDMFGSSPKTILEDEVQGVQYDDIDYDAGDIYTYVKNVLRLESVACKDWLTNKVDRCVGGKVAQQQCVGALQLPLSDCAVMALDYDGIKGVATSIGHAPIGGLINAAIGARNAVAEALTNMIWAPLEESLTSVSLSANWMWPCKNPGEDARLYEAVQALSELCIALGINVPTGKDSLSMKQKYEDYSVIAPGTVIVSTVGHCSDITRIVKPVFEVGGGAIYYIDFSQDDYRLGGSAFGQTRGKIGIDVPDIEDIDHFINGFKAIQSAISNDMVIAGHDISAGGMITTLLEMCFAEIALGAQIDLSEIGVDDMVRLLLSENAGIVFQAHEEIEEHLNRAGVGFFKIGTVLPRAAVEIKNGSDHLIFDVETYRDVWYETSYLLDSKQTNGQLASIRYENYKLQPLNFVFPDVYPRRLDDIRPGMIRPVAAILREKGSNSEREMAHALFLAGFDVRDVHMTDLISGRETLEDIRFLGIVGGFSNSDVLGSAKGWAGAFRYNDRAKQALSRFFDRSDVLSIGICNGCQLMMELDLIYPEHEKNSFLDYNDSGKHESAFTSVVVQPNKSVMMSNLAGSTLGVWISHGEGKYVLPMPKDDYHIVAQYGYTSYPSNPNGSDYNTAMLCSADGRHLVTMPHIERSIFQWNWAHYPKDLCNDQLSPWLQAFLNARMWIEDHNA